MSTTVETDARTVSIDLQGRYWILERIVRDEIEGERDKIVHHVRSADDSGGQSLARSLAALDLWDAMFLALAKRDQTFDLPLAYIDDLKHGAFREITGAGDELAHLKESVMLDADVDKQRCIVSEADMLYDYLRAVGQEAS